MLDSYKIPKLKGSINYSIWAIKIESILIKEDCFNAVVDPTTLSLINYPILGDLERINNKVPKALSLIRLSLEDNPLLLTKSISNPFILLNTLKGLYKQIGFSSIFSTSRELINTTLSKHKNNVESYLTSIIRLYNKLKSKDFALPD